MSLSDVENDGSQLTDRYLSSLGLEKAKVSLEYVSELQRAHLRKFSFNNIGVLLGRDLNLDIDPLFDRIVTKGQGGYCFEHNKLFMEVLQGLGASVGLMMGKVTREMSSEGVRAHRFTTLNLLGDEKTYLVDVGFGPSCPRQPVPIAYEEEIESRGLTYRFERNEFGETAFRAKKEDRFESLYIFDEGRYTDADCEAAHFYTRKHPASEFLSRLLVSTIRDEEVRCLYNANFRRTHSDGLFEDTNVSSAESLQKILAGEFEIEVDEKEADVLYTAAARFQAHR